MLKLTLVFAAIFTIHTVSGKLEEVFGWKEVSFNWPSEEAKNEAVNSKEYIEKNNLPLGIERWNNKLFVTVPRWRAGVAATLNYIDLSNANSTSILNPYPDWKANILPKENETIADNLIVSTFRIKADACDRLWVMDTGLADIYGDGKQINPPSILIFDLKTDKLIRRYTLKDEVVDHGSFFANIIVDVQAGKCDQAFAYIPDLGAYGIVVYSFEENDSWRVKHNFFHFDPLRGDMTVGGVNFQWTDGVFGIALGPIDENGFRTAYFHALASANEFSVNTSVLRNKTLATDHHNYNFFKLEGFKGENTQSSSSVFDQKSNVIFLTQLTKDGVACWNPRTKLEPANVALVVQDHEKLIFTNDIQVDQERNLWILSDRMPNFLYKELDPTQINYRILKISVDEAIQGTPCVA